MGVHERMLLNSRHSPASGEVIQHQLVLGLVGTSLKPDELRVPIHPGHFERVPEELRQRMIIEAGYGDRFGTSDEELAELFSRVVSREEIFASADIVLVPKPQHDDLRAMQDHQTLWGWPHCVQDEELTQIAIDKKLSLIAFEAMNHWNADGSFNLHVFHANNELAGYCSVLHALQLQGKTGDYGQRLTATVIGFGATARGAITALNALGISDVRVLTNRAVAAVASPIHSVEIVQFDHEEGPYLSEVITTEGRVPIAPFLAESDLVVNCTLQNPNAPMFYLHEDDINLFQTGSLIIDVSCDEAMGFSWAKPTSFDNPTLELGHGVIYYAVDHSPSYLWNSASWENSLALLPFLPTIMSGPQAWKEDQTVARAIEILDGEIQNTEILDYQRREPAYPHSMIS